MAILLPSLRAQRAQPGNPRPFHSPGAHLLEIPLLRFRRDLRTAFDKRQGRTPASYLTDLKTGRKDFSLPRNLPIASIHRLTRSPATCLHTWRIPPPRGALAKGTWDPGWMMTRVAGRRPHRGLCSALRSQGLGCPCQLTPVHMFSPISNQAVYF